MFCPKCGKEIPNDSKFCPECGEKVEVEEVKVEVIYDEKVKKNSKLNGCNIAAIAFCALGILSFFSNLAESTVVIAYIAALFEMFFENGVALTIATVIFGISCARVVFLILGVSLYPSMISKGKKYPLALKIFTLLCGSLIAGILMLCDKNKKVEE